MPEVPAVVPSESDEPRAPDALDAAVCLTRLRQRMFASVEVESIGPYQITRKLGGGGMGLVFAGWDPSLDRVVALKVLRDPWTDGNGAQLRKEAKALARLQHPAVVSVFEVGEHDGQGYIAMEYVEGETLREWARGWRAQRPRDEAALLDVFEQATLGLAAAHAAGVVHRDVKPENMMLDEHGRVRLMDFGLARWLDADKDPPNAETTTGPQTHGDGSGASTFGVYGTPNYMAPEQLVGGPVESAADQFALAACLYEVLTEQKIRPDAGVLEMAADEQTGVQLRFDAPGVRRYERLLRKALSIDPEQRFASMEAMHRALLRLRRGRRGLVVGVAGVSVAAMGLAIGLGLSGGESPCTHSDERWSEVLDDARADEFGALAAESPKPWVAGAWSRTQDQLDRYGTRWIDAHQQTCEAARVHGEISTAQLDLRMACLDDRQRHAGAFVDLLHNDGIDALATAEQSLEGLPTIEDCLDAEYVGRQGYQARDPEHAHEVDEQLARADALLARGAPVRAREAAEQVVAQSDAATDAPARARALLALGRGQARLDESSEAERSLVEAYELARTLGLGDFATEAATELADVVGIDLSRFDEGRWWLRMADLEGEMVDRPDLDLVRHDVAIHLLQTAGRTEDALARAEALQGALDSSPDVETSARARSELRLGRLQMQVGAVDEGLAKAEVARERLEQLLGADHPSLARVHRQLAFGLRLKGERPRSVEHARRALELAQSAVGPRHVSLARHLESLSNAVLQTGAQKESLALLDRALALDEPRPLGEVTTAHILGRRGDTLTAGDPAGALAAYTEAHELSSKAVGEQHRATISHLVGRGTVLAALGRMDEAADALREALVLGKAVLGTQHPDVARIYFAVANVVQQGGELESALEHHRAGIAIWQRTYGPKSATLIGPTINVCGVLAMMERAQEALDVCDQAAILRDGIEGANDFTLADLENNRGNALSQLSRPAETRTAYEAARDAWHRALGEGSYEESIAIANLAELAETQGEKRRAAMLYAEALEIRLARLGPKHPALARVRDGLARNQN